MISYPEALDIITAAAVPLSGSDQELLKLEGCATTGDVVSQLDVPAFANSAMDGFAVRVADTANASPNEPLELPVVGTLAAGDAVPIEPVTAGAMEIMTGAPVPPGSDSIVPIEQVEVTQRCKIEGVEHGLARRAIHKGRSHLPFP